MEDEKGHKKEKIALEVAEQEFDSFADAWRLDTEIDTMDEEDAQDFIIGKRKIVNEIRRGSLVVNDEGDLVYNLFEPVGSLDQIILKRPKGLAWKMSDRAKLNKNVGKTNYIMAAGIGQPPGILTRMDGIDYKFILSVYNLFLGS